MATSTYFLGANTPEGFCSQYDTLFRDVRIRELLILKGGPGCGKSTLMRRVSEAARARGLDAEEILCSSDPDSLDGLIVPQAGLALVDGTAPHVVEPPLCGLGARYLDLGRFYDSGVLAQVRSSLQAAKEKNAACYPLCYGALEAAGAACSGLHNLASSALPEGTLLDLKAALTPKLLPAGRGVGQERRRYLNAVTPKGLLALPPDCETVHLLRDSYGLASPLLAAIRREYISAGHTVVSCLDPLQPRRLQAVLLPELGTAFICVSTLFPLAVEAADVFDLDALVEERISYDAGQRLQAFAQLREQAVQEALVHLASAKRHHDALEQLYRPAVDFSGLDAAAAEVLELLP